MKKTMVVFMTSLLLLTVLSCFCSTGAFADEITVSDISFKSGADEVFKVFDGKIKSEAAFHAGGSGRVFAIAASYSDTECTRLMDVSLAFADLTGEEQTVSTNEINASKDGIVKAYVWNASTFEPAVSSKKLTALSSDTRLKDVTFTAGGERYYILFDDNEGTAKTFVKSDNAVDFGSVPAKVRTMSGNVSETTLDLTGSSLSFNTVAENGDSKEYTYNTLTKKNLTLFWDEKWTGAVINEETFVPSNGTFTKEPNGGNYKWSARTSNDNAVLGIKKWTDTYSNQGEDNDVLSVKRGAGWEPTIVYRLEPYGMGVAVAEVDVYPTCEFKFVLGGPGFIIGNRKIRANTKDNFAGEAYGTAETRFTFGEWHHISFVLEKTKSSDRIGKVSIYIDGKLWGSKDGVATTYNNDSSISDGWKPGSMRQVFGIEPTSGSTAETYFDNNRYLGLWIG